MSTTLFPLSIQQPFVLFPGNSIPVLWALILGSTWNTTKTPITDATGTLTIYDSTGTPVPGADGIAFTTTDTPGTYQALIDGTMFNPPVGSGYTSIIEMSSTSASAVGQWTIATVIRPRTTA